jgi:hypothetical protein
MTAQIRDTVLFRGHEFAVAACDGLGLFEPYHHGLTPVMVSSACRRGYRCRYAIAPEGLVLDQLAIALAGRDAEAARRGMGPLLFGRPPALRVYEDEGDEPAYLYEGLRAPIRFTGRLLVGSGIVRELSGLRGLPAIYGFREVVEQVFEHGRLVQMVDRSSQVAAARDGRLRPTTLAASTELIDLLRWVERMRFDPLG